MATEHTPALEEQIAHWRSYVRRRQAIHASDVEELEGHLRDQVEALLAAGLKEDEAFLIAVKRIGNLDALSREFAREHSERLWKQLVLAPDHEGETTGTGRKETVVVIGLAIAAALAFKLPALFGLEMIGAGEEFYARNFSLFALPLLAAYFAWKRGMTARSLLWLAPPFIGASVFANVYPFASQGHTAILLIMHLPLALWLVTGFAYAGGDWRSSRKRMDFIRFTGELAIYYVLIALGGGVLTGFTIGMFEMIGFDAEFLAPEWIVPCGALGAVLVASWLVEAKQSVVENMAPVLTKIFTPLFALLLLVFLGTLAWTRSAVRVEREVLIGCDLMLALVLGLLLYAVSARDSEAPPGIFDGFQLVLVVGALVVDVLALLAIASRISEFGLSPNRVAALGENLILMVNLAWSAWLYLRFMRGRGAFTDLERWQTAYLPVYAVWAWIVVIVFPPAFDFI